MEKVCFFIAALVFIISIACYNVYRYIMQQKMLKQCMTFGEQLQNGEVKLFFNYKGKVCGVDALGDFILKQGFVNERNEEVNILQDVEKEVIFPNLTSDSKIPSQAYQVGFSETVLNKRNDLPVVKISLQPLSGCRDAWSVVDTDIIVEDRLKGKIHLVLLMHPVMGTLLHPKSALEKKLDQIVEFGQTVILEQEVHQVSDNLWHMTYC